MGFVFREFTSDELADIRRKIKGEVVQLYWKGAVGAFTFAFDITSITIPNTLNQKPEMIRQTIKAAVEVYKHALRPGDYKVAATLPAMIG